MYYKRVTGKVFVHILDDTRFVKVEIWKNEHIMQIGSNPSTVANVERTYDGITEEEFNNHYKIALEQFNNYALHSKILIG